MIDYKIQNLNHESTVELAREASQVMAHQVMQMTEKDVEYISKAINILSSSTSCREKIVNNKVINIFQSLQKIKITI
jgi:galactokinase/mevalonate kinase-like predicted kinase